MQSKATSVEQYLASLPEDRRRAIETVRRVIIENLDRGPDGRSGFEEGMQYGMIGYFVPHAVFPPGYHCDPRQPLPFAGLASQKQHMSLYTMALYTGPASAPLLEWFTKAWTAGGRKLDMGKACIRFKKLEDVPLEVVGELFRRVTAAQFIDSYQRALGDRGKSAPSSKPRPSATAGKTSKPAARRATKAAEPAKKAAKKAPAKAAASGRRSARRVAK